MKQLDMKDPGSNYILTDTQYRAMAEGGVDTQGEFVPPWAPNIRGFFEMASVSVSEDTPGTDEFRMLETEMRGVEDRNFREALFEQCVGAAVRLLLRRFSRLPGVAAPSRVRGCDCRIT